MINNHRKIFTFGEIMLRISPALIGERVVQSSAFTIKPGGSESNVAVALSCLGNQCAFVTKLPAGVLSDKIIRYLKSYSVDTSYIVFRGERIGLYWTEIGSGVRPSQVIYDRQNSSFSTINYGDFDWKTIFKNTSWFHTSGISAAVSENVYRVLKEALDSAPADVRISIDLNYRSKLWKWEKTKRLSVHRFMRNMCSNVYLIAGNESDFFNALGMGSGKEKTLNDYKKLALQCFRRFSNLKYVAISLRESISASENGWSGLLFARKTNRIVRYKGPELRITDIVDRIGTGDSFTAGLIHGIINHEQNLQYVIEFAVALSALNHSVRGDASQFNVDDVEHLLNNPGSRIIR